MLLTTVGFVLVYTQKSSVLAVSSLSYGGIFLGLFIVAHIGRRFLAPFADPYLLPVTALLSTLGLLVIYRINEKLALQQAQWLVVGSPRGFFWCWLSCAIIHWLQPAPAHHRHSGHLGVASQHGGLGHDVNGARLWVSLGPIGFQPRRVRQGLARYLLRRVPGGRARGVDGEHPPHPGRAGAAFPVSGAASEHLGIVDAPDDLHEGSRDQPSVLRRSSCPAVRGHRAALLCGRRRRCCSSSGPPCSTRSSRTCVCAWTCG